MAFRSTPRFLKWILDSTFKVQKYIFFVTLGGQPLFQFRFIFHGIRLFEPKENLMNDRSRGEGCLFSESVVAHEYYGE